MHLVTLTVPLKMSNFTMSHAAPDHDLQKMLHSQIQVLRLEFFSKMLPHLHVGLIANIQEVLSSLTITFSYILQLQLAYRLWTLVISRFMSALQDFRPNCRHRRHTVDELAATLHFSHHSCRSSSDFNLRLVKDMLRWVGPRFWWCSGSCDMKVKVVSLKILILKATINTTYVALVSISSKAGCWRNAKVFSAARLMHEL